MKMSHGFSTTIIERHLTGYTLFFGILYERTDLNTLGLLSRADLGILVGAFQIYVNDMYYRLPRIYPPLLAMQCTAWADHLVAKEVIHDNAHHWQIILW